MNSLPPINSEKIDEIRNEMKSFPEIDKHYGDWLEKALTSKDPRTFPIVKQFLIRNYNYLKLLDQVLSETSGVKGFPTIVKRSKNKTEFYYEFSILKLGKILKETGYTFEFIPPGGEPKPDIKARIWDNDVFFEVKHLRSTDETNDLLFDYFNEYPSKFTVSITLDDTVTLAQIQECIQMIKTVS